MEKDAVSIVFKLCLSTNEMNKNILFLFIIPCQKMLVMLAFWNFLWYDEKRGGDSVIRIAVVDDVVEICSHIERYMQHFSLKYDQKIEVEPYTSSSAFFKGIKENHEVYDLIFLDIELDEKTGIDIANYIRYEQQDELQQIVYISGKSTYSLALHDTHPLDFLVKPLQENKLEKIMLRFLKISGRWTDTFSYQIGRDIIKVKIIDIQYFIVNNKEIIIHTIHGEDTFHGSLKQIERQLRKYNFLYIHRSYLVNAAYIKIYEYDRVILYDETYLPIGSSKRAEICRKRMELQRFKKEEN